MEELNCLKLQIIDELGEDKVMAVVTYLQFAIDKGFDYNSRQTRWEYARGVVISILSCRKRLTESSEHATWSGFGAAVGAACRLSDAMKVKKTDLTVRMVSSGIEQEIAKKVKLYRRWD